MEYQYWKDGISVLNLIPEKLIVYMIIFLNGITLMIWYIFTN